LSSFGALAFGLYKYKQINNLEKGKEEKQKEYVASNIKQSSFSESVKILPCGCVIRIINDDDGNVSVAHKCEIKMDPGITQAEINLNSLDFVSDKY
jgi:hypothetical protein